MSPTHTSTRIEPEQNGHEFNELEIFPLNNYNNLYIIKYLSFSPNATEIYWVKIICSTSSSQSLSISHCVARIHFEFSINVALRMPYLSDLIKCECKINPWSGIWSKNETRQKKNETAWITWDLEIVQKEKKTAPHVNMV